MWSWTFLKACEIKKISAEGIEANTKLCNLSKKFLKKNKLSNVDLDYFEDKIKIQINHA